MSLVKKTFRLSLSLYASIAFSFSVDMAQETSPESQISNCANVIIAQSFEPCLAVMDGVENSLMQDAEKGLTPGEVVESSNTDAGSEVLGDQLDAFLQNVKENGTVTQNIDCLSCQHQFPVAGTPGKVNKYEEHGCSVKSPQILSLSPTTINKHHAHEFMMNIPVYGRNISVNARHSRS